MKRLFLTTVVFICVIGASAQTSSSNSKTLLCEKVKNTYQVVVENYRTKVAVPSDVCEIVEKERRQDVVTYYKFSDAITLKIYPVSQLPSLPKNLPYIIYKSQE